MARKVERVSRGKSVAVRGEGKRSGALRKRAAPTRDQGHVALAGPSLVGEGSLENPYMPGLRIREDGWTGTRTRVFLAVLAQTGCVADAARIAGVSTTSVNRSRRLFAPFDKACVEALANALRGLEAVAYQRAVVGRETVIFRGGKEFERRIVPSDNLLRLLIKRGDLSGALGRALTPAEAEAFVLPEAVRHRFIDRAEAESGIIFEHGVKQQRHIATQEETDAFLIHKIAMIKKMRATRGPEHPCCETCGQKMPLTEAEMDALEAKWEGEDDAEATCLPSPQPPSPSAMA